MKDSSRQSIFTVMLAVVIIIGFIFSMKAYTMRVYATELKTLDLNNITQRECRNEMSDILLDIIKHDSTSFQTKSQYFTNDCYTELSDYVVNNDIGSTIITDLVVDYTTPNNSDTQDTVIMCNAKIQFSKYNKLYLFEFHVNKDSKIYGYNVWVY